MRNRESFFNVSPKVYFKLYGIRLTPVARPSFILKVLAGSLVYSRAGLNLTSCNRSQRLRRLKVSESCSLVINSKQQQRRGLRYLPLCIIYPRLIFETREIKRVWHEVSRVPQSACSAPRAGQCDWKTVSSPGIDLLLLLLLLLRFSHLSPCSYHFYFSRGHPLIYLLIILSVTDSPVIQLQPLEVLPDSMREHCSVK